MTGQHIKPWSGPEVGKARKQVAQRGYANNTPCCICGQPIDYRLPPTDPNGMTIQHVKPRATHPHLTWDKTNWAPAHAQCNQAAGTKIQTGLGTRTPKWA